MSRNLISDNHEKISLTKIRLIKKKTKLHNELSKTYRLENIANYENCITNKQKISQLIPEILEKDFYIKVKNVGQGSCNSFCKLRISDSDNVARPEEFLYLACGGGITANQKTYPNDVDFSPQNDALNILCHWDMDHWVSAEHKPELKNKVNWLVPNQSPIGMSHLKLANELSKNNRLFIWPSALSSASTDLLDIHKLKSHKNRNYSGLVIIAKSCANSSGKDFFYSGDAAFKHCSSFIDKYNLRIITVPHHGGKMPKKAIPRAPNQHLIVCSYGEDNTFGHPYEISKNTDLNTKNRYKAQGWTYWKATTGGSINIYPSSIKTKHLNEIDFMTSIFSIQREFI